jgi:3-(3-hydroxy-phenyl)propionate hydroxylase
MVARAAAQAGTPQTAADLIQPIATGIILAGSTGAGERFIQPELADGRKLDDATGQGWRLFVDGPAPDTKGMTVVNIATIDDGGALRQWLAARDALAVLVRPDHYVFGTGTPATLIAAQAAALGHVAETVA